MKWVHDMNDTALRNRCLSSAGTAAVVALAAAMASGETKWPSHVKSAYTVDQQFSSYSAFAAEAINILPTVPAGFAEMISAFYAELSKGQEPLGAAFEAVWDANVDKLYEP